MSSVCSTSKGVLCTSRQLDVNGPMLAGPYAMMPVWLAYARNRIGVHPSPGNFTSTPVRLGLVECTANRSPNQCSTRRPPSDSTGTGLSPKAAVGAEAEARAERRNSIARILYWLSSLRGGCLWPVSR